MKLHSSLIRNAMCTAMICCQLATGSAQSEIRGKVIDATDKSPLIGAHVTVQETGGATVTDTAGYFRIGINKSLPVQISITYLGYRRTEINITESTTDVTIGMEPQSHLMEAIEISVSRVPESALKSPWSVEVLTPLDIRVSPSLDFYDQIGNLRGVSMQTSSITFPAVTTRGFAVPGNRRFVQLIDGMDNSAPLLNFPLGNIVGISELDALSAELVPGTASALYGPNAFNGILMLRSKSPFEHQGLDIDMKGGFMSAESVSHEPLYQVSGRYARSFLNHRLAFKVNATCLQAQDWKANDYRAGVTSPVTGESAGPDAPDFDGMNLYGDETQIYVPMSVILGPFKDLLPAPAYEALLAGPPLDLRRTGLREEDLLDHQDAKSLKLDGAIHYRIASGMELSYAYRYGRGSTVYQGGERYALRDFTFKMQKLELAGHRLNARAYMTQTDAGDSYNLTALGGLVNERLRATESMWVPLYASAYVQHLLTSLQSKGYYDTSDIRTAHNLGRGVADNGIPQPGGSEFKAIVDTVRSLLFQRTPPGAKFFDDSRLYHVEGTYLIPAVTKGLDILLGGNYRMYDLFSDGTVFNEDPDETGKNQRIQNQEYGAFVQLQQNLLRDRLQLTGSLRYDKNENFKGQVSPRIAIVYQAGEDREHALRASFQTGFRNPSSQEQFIYFPLPTAILLGGTAQNAGRYGIYEGGAISNASYLKFLTTGDSSVLTTLNIPYVQPERVQVYEAGYKAIIGGRLYMDINVYHSRYRDFIAQQTVRLKTGTTHQGAELPGVEDVLAGEAAMATAFRIYANSKSRISATGAGIGLDYLMPRGYHLYGHYTYSTYKAQDEEPGFDAGFNMPGHIMLLGAKNAEVFSNFGFDVNYRWQSAFDWESAFTYTRLPAFGTLNASVSYEIKPTNMIIKLGGTNLTGKDYRNIGGGPAIGRTLVLGITFSLGN